MGWGKRGGQRPQVGLLWYPPGCASPCTFGWNLNKNIPFWISLFLVIVLIIKLAYYLQQTRVHQLMAMATQRRKGYSYLWMYLPCICIVFVLYLKCMCIVFVLYLHFTYICIISVLHICFVFLQPMAIASQKRKRYLSSTCLKFDCIFVLVCNTEHHARIKGGRHPLLYFDIFLQFSFHLGLTCSWWRWWRRQELISQSWRGWRASRTQVPTEFGFCKSFIFLS